MNVQMAAAVGQRYKLTVISGNKRTTFGRETGDVSKRERRDRR